MGDIVGRALDREHLSDRNVALMRGWLKDCVLSHRLCVRNADAPPSTNLQESPGVLPSRLIDIESVPDISCVRLVQTLGQYGTYATLSHCWGRSQILTTTIETLDQRMTRIDLTSLPKTFRDAVVIARRFGTRYLWIDSLCILQDDVDDWNEQAPLMGQIYRNAHYTIAATGATGGEIGCLITRGTEAVPPVTIRYTSQRYQDRPCEMTVALPHGSFGATIERAPLNRRAWVLQERILSRRILHFGAEQIYFECQRHSLAEDGSQQYATGQLKQSFDLRDYHGPEREDLKQHEWQTIQPLFWRWCRVVQDYSLRGLTKSTDKLPALAGLADQVQKRNGDEYFAGMWREGLHISLLWRAKTKGSLRYPPSFRAPSWSWAAVDGALSFDSLHAGTLALNSEERASLGSWNITRSSTLGAESENWVIALSAARKRATYTSELPVEERDSHIIRDTEGREIGVGLFDIEPARLPINVDCLFISEYPSSASTNFSSGGCGILLIEEVAEEQGTFRRVGAGHVTDMEFFHGCPRDEIRLI